MRIKNLLLSLCPTLVLTAAAAQTPPGLSIAKPAKTAHGHAGPRLALGRQALAAGRTDEAYAHLIAALEFDPNSADVLHALLECSQSDADAKLLWALRWWQASADARGQAKPDRATMALLPPLDDIRKIAKARTAAVEELARYVGRLKPGNKNAAGNGMLARWATDLAARVSRETPALRTAHAESINAACARHAPDYMTVLKALRKLMTSPPAASGEDAAAALLRAQDLAMRAARCITGLAAQAKFKDLEGPKPPNLDSFERAAKDTREKLRARVAERAGEPLTIAQLEALTRDEREKFTADHSTWANPGLALSPKGLYLIETTCGFDTLLGAAQTIEMHHRRLVNWYGKDPCQSRGTVRILPEHAGLESDDTPFWWAGGFQRGDLTTVRFAWSTIPALGRTLTHELTHRFDGKVFAFMPSWMVEGRAVWTASAYAAPETERFTVDRLSPNTVQTASVKGYGRAGKLRKLITGEIDDYRDNYTAGYALFVYLDTWKKNGKRIYKERLQRYMKNARGGRKKPLQFFETHFVDGEDGRPAEFDKFAEEFGAFLQGCYRWCWGERDVAWMRNYKLGNPGKQTRARTVNDEPSWSWARRRAEPWFGDDHAATAGHLLAEVGAHQAAFVALLWSLQTDGWRRANVELLAQMADKIRRKDVAWFARHRVDQAKGPAPMLRALPKTKALLEKLREAAKAQAVARNLWAARALAVEHDDLAHLVGERPLPPAAPSDGTAKPRYPIVSNPIALNAHGWLEGGLTDFEDRRRDGLWFETDTGDLHVGRAKPRDKSGLLDRRAHQRHAFVRSAEWLERGRYVFKTRVHFTTSYVSGAFVLGYSRRDRNIRLNFKAGDFLYSLGRKDAAETTESVELNISGLWERGRHMPSSRPRGSHEFEQPSSSFALEVWIDGPTVRVVVEGEMMFSYTTPDRSPIEGHVGVAMGQGAVRLQEPRIQRLDRGELTRARSDASLDPADPTQYRIDDMMRRSVHGIPLSRHGTIVIWIPPSDYAEMRADGALYRLKEELDNTPDYPQHWVLALPESLAEDVRKRFAVRLAQAAPDRSSTIVHRKNRPFDDFAWAMFVDATGVLRAVQEMAGRKGKIPGVVERWARRYRTR